MRKARVIEHKGQLWVNLEDLRLSLREDETMQHAAAMLHVGRNKGLAPLEMLRGSFAYVITEMTGVLDDQDN